MLLEQRLDARRNVHQVRVRHIGEQVMLDLVAQVARQPSRKGRRRRVGGVLARAIDPTRVSERNTNKTTAYQSRL